MKTYRVTITADKYPTEYIVSATGWATAIARAIREWKANKGKGSRTQLLSVRAVKSGELLIAKEN
jgi:hypothetical protein